MKKKYYFLIICGIFLFSWVGYSLAQPAIIKGKSENWKAVYKPRKGSTADTEKYPWAGKITWNHLLGEAELINMDLLVDGKYVNMLDRNASKKGNGNFDGRTVTDYETFYNGPDQSIQGMKISWKKNKKVYTEAFKFKREKRLFVMPLF